MTASW